MTYYATLDIVEAHLLFNSHYHEGMRSKKYHRMCKILSYFKPRPNLYFSTLTENGQYIFTNLVKQEEGIHEWN